MDIILKIKEELNVEKWQVEAAVKLIDEGNTIPFISRYRKEATGSLNDEQLRNLGERLTYLRNLEDKKAQVIGSIEEQGKLTEELRAKIEEAQTVLRREHEQALLRKKVWNDWLIIFWHRTQQKQLKQKRLSMSARKKK